MHAGPSRWRQSRATGAMVTQARPDGTIAWVTGTSANCISIFKPVFVEVEWAGMPAPPTEQFDPRSLWWRHELLHRRAMADFDTLVPEMRAEFDRMEQEFLAAAEAIRAGTAREK